MSLIEITFEKVMPTYAPNRCIPCDVCGTATPHALMRDGEHYACGICGTKILYIVNEAKDGRAMDLRETHDAQDRFADWCDEQ